MFSSYFFYIIFFKLLIYLFLSLSPFSSSSFEYTCTILLCTDFCKTHMLVGTAMWHMCNNITHKF